MNPGASVDSDEDGEIASAGSVSGALAASQTNDSARSSASLDSAAKVAAVSIREACVARDAITTSSASPAALVAITAIDTSTSTSENPFVTGFHYCNLRSIGRPRETSRNA